MINKTKTNLRIRKIRKMMTRTKTEMTTRIVMRTETKIVKMTTIRRKTKARTEMRRDNQRRGVRSSPRSKRDSE